MEDVLTELNHAEQFTDLDDAVFAVLTRHRQPATRACPFPVRSEGEPVVENERLPPVGNQAVLGCERNCFRPESVEVGLGRRDPNPGHLSAKDGAVEDG